MGFTRREFILLGVATGATAAVGIVVPLSVASREFTETGGTIAGTGAAEPLGIVSVFPRAKVAQLTSVEEGRPVFFDYPLVGQSNVLVKLGEPVAGGQGPDGDLVAFSRICTHMGCLLEEYQHEHKALGPCPCHFSTFDLAHDGMVTLGQATQNLPRVLLEVDGDDIYAGGTLRLVYGFDNTLAGAELVEASS